MKRTRSRWNLRQRITQLNRELDPFHAFEIWHDAHFVGGLPDLNELSERVEQYSKDKTLESGNPA